MHSFCELAKDSTTFTLGALDVLRKSTSEELQISGSTRFVTTLQMVQLQKVISAVGMFAIFEAHLQEQLNCEHGFHKANQILKMAGEVELCQQFMNLQDAINVLKHGRGRSYERLLKISETLSFRIKQADEVFFNEGDVSEVLTLIEVDDRFVELCADVIYKVSTVLKPL